MAASDILPFSRLREALEHLPQEDQVRVQQAYDLALSAHEEQKREDSTPYVNHVIETALIVASWHGDADTIIGSLLHDTLEDTTVTKSHIKEVFGRHVALLVEGVTKFSSTDFSQHSSLDTKIETVRRLFEVMRRDIRVIIIKLADRLHNIRTIHFLQGDRKKRFAKETMDLYYKLAVHLGMRAVYCEYSDVCVPLVYAEGAAFIKRQSERIESGASLVGEIRSSLDTHGLQTSIVDLFLQPNDVCASLKRATRTQDMVGCDAYSIIAIVRTEHDCYQLLKSLHTLFRPVHAQFRDYIATPGTAGYRSLHTTVTLKTGEAVEIRIRTMSMHEQAEKGIVTSLFGKESIDPLSQFPWLKRSEDLDLTTRESSQAFWQGLESDILQESIVVIVNDIRVSLPRGGTVLDAAYVAFGARANASVAARVAGRTVSLSHALEEDDMVYMEIDSRQEHVDAEWLKYVITSNARSHVVDVLKKRSREDKIALGASLLQTEMDRYNRGPLHEIRKSDRQKAAALFRRAHFSEVLAMIGEGSLRPRELVFAVFSDTSQGRYFSRHRPSRYTFRLCVTGVQERQHDVLSSLVEFSRTKGIDIRSTRVRFDSKTGVFSIILIGSASDRLHYADFIDALERQDAVSSVQSLVPYRDNALLVGAFCVSFAFLLADVIFLPQYQYWLPTPGIPRAIMHALPLVPVLIANTLLLRLMQKYIVRMRTDRWFVGVGFLFNIIALLLIVLRLLSTQSDVSILPLLALFVLSLLFIGYRFFQAEALFSVIEKSRSTHISAADWKSIRRRKRVGYAIRLAAIFVWGLEPIYIKYTPANDLSPFLRTFLLGLGVLIPSLIVYGATYVRQRMKKKNVSFSLVYDRFFTLFVIGQIGVMYFKNASLIYTSGTNLLLFNNFAPVIGLLIAAVFWRREIPYLRQPRTILIIFLLAVMAGIGSSLLVFNTKYLSASSSVTGDILAMISTFFDVLVTISQIEYCKRYRSVNGFLLNIHIFLCLLICTAPGMIALTLWNPAILHGLTLRTLLFGMGIGLFVGIGQLLNYAAFKRIDGYLAYMMFNLSILITFSLEVFAVHSVKPTPLLLLSAILIVGASVYAEIVNSRCEKRGL